MADEKDPPIEEQQYLGGVTVVDIGDIRVARGMSRRHHSSCPHHQLVYDGQERRIWCKDCEKDVEPFDAFRKLVEHFHTTEDRLDRRAKKLDEAEQFNIRTIAAKAMDQAWRKHNMVPACPHCGHGLFPEHFTRGGPSMVGKEYARHRLKKEAKK